MRLKTISTFLILCLGFQSLGFTEPLQNPFKAPVGRFPELVLSPKIAKISEVHRAKGGKFLIHIQDAHTNSSAQIHIARILEELIAKHKLKTVFVEGGTQDDSLTFLRPMASKTRRQRVAKKYLLKGELSGAEYLSLASDHDFRLLGVEEKELYRQNLAHYKAVVRKKEAVIAYLDEIQKRVDRLKGRLYPRTLLALDDFSRQREAGRRDFSDTLPLLLQEAKRLEIDFLSYPHLVLMEDKNLQNLPDPSKLIYEIGSLETQVFARSLTDPDAFYLHQIDEHLQSLKKLFSLESSSPEFEAYLARAKEARFTTLAMLAFINQKLYDFGYDSDIFRYLPLVDENKIHVEAFYKTAQKRDFVFIQKSLAQMRKDKEDLAVLITGGYHTAHLTSLMRRENVSYAVVTPSITTETNTRRYEKILLTSHLSVRAAVERAGAISTIENIYTDFNMPRRMGNLPQTPGARLGIIKLDPQKISSPVPGSSAQVYGDQVVNSRWYQENLDNTLNRLLEKLEPTDTVLDSSAGTGAAGLYLAKRLKEKGKKIKKLQLVDVGFPLAREMLEFAVHALESYRGVVFDEIEYFILEYDKEAKTYESVSKIPSIQNSVDHVVCLNAVHLISPPQRRKVFGDLLSILKPGGTLTIGSGNIENQEIQPKDAVFVDTLFEWVYQKLNFPTDDSLAKLRNKFLPPKPTQQDILNDLNASGFGSLDASNSTIDLGREDYRSFIVEVQDYVKMNIPELAADDKKDSRNQLTRDAYKKIFDDIEAEQKTLKMNWTKIEATKSGARLAQTQVIKGSANLEKIAFGEAVIWGGQDFLGIELGLTHPEDSEDEKRNKIHNEIFRLGGELSLEKFTEFYNKVFRDRNATSFKPEELEKELESKIPFLRNKISLEIKDSNQSAAFLLRRWILEQEKTHRQSKRIRPTQSSFSKAEEFLLRFVKEEVFPNLKYPPNSPSNQSSQENAVSPQLKAFSALYHVFFGFSYGIGAKDKSERDCTVAYKDAAFSEMDPILDNHVTDLDIYRAFEAKSKEIREKVKELRKRLSIASKNKKPQEVHLLKGNIEKFKETAKYLQRASENLNGSHSIIEIQDSAEQKRQKKENEINGFNRSFEKAKEDIRKDPLILTSWLFSDSELRSRIRLKEEFEAFNKKTEKALSFDRLTTEDIDKFLSSFLEVISRKIKNDGERTAEEKNNSLAAFKKATETLRNVLQRFQKEGWNNFENELSSFKEYIQNRIKKEGLNSERLLVEFMAQQHQTHSDMEEKFFDFCMFVYHHLRYREGKMRNSRPVVIFIDPDEDEVFSFNDYLEVKDLYRDIQGVVDQRGGPGSHYVINLTQKGRLTVTGADLSFLAAIHVGDQVIIDGTDGTVFVRPDEEKSLEMLEKKNEIEFVNDFFASRNHLPVELKGLEGLEFHTLLDLNDADENLTDPEVLKLFLGFAGVGLFRLENIFLQEKYKRFLRDMNQMTTLFKKVLDTKTIHRSHKNINNLHGRITIRLFDAQPDKLPDFISPNSDFARKIAQKAPGFEFYLSGGKEAWKFGVDQIKWSLRAAISSESPRLNLMAPRMDTKRHIKQFQRMIEQAIQEVAEEMVIIGSEPKKEIEKKLRESFKVGFMIESLDALRVVKDLVKNSDVISIGTNDMTESILQKEDKKAKRTDPGYSQKFKKVYPKLLETIWKIAKVSHEHGKPVAVCGEKGGLPIIGFYIAGIRHRLSIKSSSKPMMIYPVASVETGPKQREYLRHLTLRDIQRVIDPIIEKLEKGKPLTEKDVEKLYKLEKEVEKRIKNSDALKKFREENIGARLSQDISLDSKLASEEKTATSSSIKITYASLEDLEAILEIQKNSPAKPSIHLSREQIKSLVENNQVFLARILAEDQWKAAGAVFIHSSTRQPQSYEEVLDPSNHNRAGDFLYDFWIIVDKHYNKTADGTPVSRALIEETGKLVKESGKKSVIAYSRGANAWVDIKKEFLVSYSGKNHILKFLFSLAHEIESWFLSWMIKINSSYRAKLLLRYILKTRPDIQKNDPGKLDYFLSWLEKKSPQALVSAKISQLKSPSFWNPWNPATDLLFLRSVSLLLKKYIKETDFIPVDPTIGGLHSSLGAFIAGIKLGSRPDDTDALGSNVLMSYEEISDLDKAIDEALSEARQEVSAKGARLMEDEEVYPLRGDEAGSEIQEGVFENNGFDLKFSVHKEKKQVQILELSLPARFSIKNTQGLEDFKNFMDLFSKEFKGLQVFAIFDLGILTQDKMSVLYEFLYKHTKTEFFQATSSKAKKMFFYDGQRKINPTDEVALINFEPEGARLTGSRDHLPEMFGTLSALLHSYYSIFHQVIAEIPNMKEPRDFVLKNHASFKAYKLADELRLMVSDLDKKGFHEKLEMLNGFIDQLNTVDLGFSKEFDLFRHHPFDNRNLHATDLSKKNLEINSTFKRLLLTLRQEEVVAVKQTFPAQYVSEIILLNDSQNSPSNKEGARLVADRIGGALFSQIREGDPWAVPVGGRLSNLRKSAAGVLVEVDGLEIDVPAPAVGGKRDTVSAQKVSQEIADSLTPESILTFVLPLEAASEEMAEFLRKAARQKGARMAVIFTVSDKNFSNEIWHNIEKLSSEEVSFEILKLKTVQGLWEEVLGKVGGDQQKIGKLVIAADLEQMRKNSSLFHSSPLVSKELQEKTKWMGLEFPESASYKIDPVLVAAGALHAAMGGFVRSEWGTFFKQQYDPRFGTYLVVRPVLDKELRLLRHSQSTLQAA
jgi:phosphoenolpyruvate-protein kinase (PTS system EI component)/SAM-dependent methyltransferase